MSIATFQTRSAKIGLIVVAAAAIAAVGVFFALQQAAPVQQVSAAQPGDFGLQDGALITAYNAVGDPDVFVIKEVSPSATKRVFKNPTIGYMYGQFGANGIFTPGVMKQVPAATRDAFVLGCYVRNAETNDPKVYYVESTGADTGTLHWVNVSAADANLADPLFFPKTFDINNAEFNFYQMGSAYTSMSQVPACTTGETGATPTPSSGPLSVSLAADNPAAKTITLNATGVEFLKVRVSGTGTVNGLTVKRLGPGETNDFANVYVYQGATRLTSGKSFSSATGETTFLLNVPVSGFVDLSIIADMDGTNNTAGNVNYVQLTSLTATGGATVTGAPVSGNNVTTSGASSGSVTITTSGSLGNPTVGQMNAQISEFKITANTETASVRRLTLINGGTVKASDILNLKLMVGGSTYNGTMTTDGYAVFDLGSGYTIAKGGNAIFKMYADLRGKKDETLDFYFENDADTYAVGDQYQQGMAVTDTAMDAASDVTDLTLQGGVLTISFNGPNATNVSTNATDVTLLRYSMTAAANIEIRKTEFVLCVDTTGDGTFDAAADETEWDELTDFKVWNEATNTVVMGPKDGTSFNDSNDSDTCPDSVTGAKETFTDVLDLVAGQTYNFKVTADFDTSLGGSLTQGGSIVRAVLDRYDDNTADLTVMKYSGTNTSVADADIVPNADVAGPNITLQASSLTLGLASSPQDRTYIKGTNGVEFVGITFTAALGSELKVTDITLTGYAEDETGEAHDEGVAPSEDTGVSVANAVGSLSIYEAETGNLISSSPTNNQLAVAGTGTIKFAGLNWVIPAGGTKTLLVKGNLSTNSASGSNGDRYAFDIGSTAHVTALDPSNNTVNPGNSGVNGGTSPTVDITVKNSGTITVAAAPDTPSTAGVYWKQTGVTFSKFRFTTTNEGQYLETLNFNTGDTAGDLTNNVKKVYLSYKNKAGTTLVQEGSFNTAGSVSFSFTGDSRPYVPADSTLDVTVKADMKSKAEGASNNVAFSIDFSGGNADEFRAVGESGTVTDGDDSANIVDRTANNMRVYRVFPKFSKVSDAAYEANSSVLNPTEMEVLRFTIEAMGDPDSKLLFDNAATGSGSITFEVVASGVGSNTPTFKVYDASDGSAVDVNGTITNATLPSPKASIAFDFTSRDIEISGGQSKTFYMRVDLTNFSHDGDYFQVVLRDDESGLINWVADSTGSTNDLDTASTTGVLRNLEMIGTTKVRNL